MTQIPEDVLRAVIQHQRVPVYDGTYTNQCVGCDHLKGESDGPNSPRVVSHQIEMLRQHLAKEQYGVQIVYKDPKAAGAVSDEPCWYWFDTIEQADYFAQRPAHEMRTLAEYGGVKEVLRAERWAIEIYGEPVSTGQSFSCHVIKPGDDLPQAQCLLLKGHSGPHDMMGMVQW